MSEFETGRYAVFGGTSGVGFEVAKRLYNSGSDVIVTCRDPSKMALLSAAQGELQFVKWDLHNNDTSTVTTMTNSLTQLGGPVHGVFFSAAEPVVAPIRHFDVTDDKISSALNEVRAFTQLLRALTRKGLAADGCSVVAMSSVAAVQGVPSLSAYSAAKAAVEATVRCAAVELAPKIRVNCVRAAAFESPLHARLMKKLPDSAAKAYRDAHPLGFGTTQDVAEAVLFLLSSSSRWITGTSMVVDGGYSAKAR